MSNKIILSTDIGTDIDDALTLHISMRHPEIQLDGVYVTNGNLSARAKIAKAMTDLAQHPTTIALGESEALNKHPPYSTGHEEDLVLPDYREKSFEQLGIIENGIDDLVKRLKSDNPTIVSIAPLTNVARAIEKSPELDRKGTVVYLMGGRENNPEHNFRHDVDAARKVLGSNLELVVVSADVCGRYRKPLTEFEGMESESGKYIRDMLHNWVSYNTWRGFVLSNATVDYARMKGQGAKFPEFFTRLLDALNDPTFVKEHPEEYHSTFCSMMGILERHKDKPFFNELYRNIIANIPKDVAVHDTFTLYALLHPEKIKTKRANLSVGVNGETFVEKGRRHNLVTDLDYGHFKGFLRTYLK